MPTIEQALTEFTPDAVTHKVLTALYGVVPYSPDFGYWSSVDDAVRALKPDATQADFLRARDIAANTEALQDILWMAKLMDMGDTGYAIATGLFSAVQMFRGAGVSEALETDTQQRNDAVLKALGLAYMVLKAYPGSLSEKVSAFRASPTGQAMSIYYGAIEVALPFADNALTSGSGALNTLYADRVGPQLQRLTSMAGDHDVSQAGQMLGEMTGQLQKVVDLTGQYTRPVVDKVAPYVPGAVDGADKTAGVIANAADVLPVYRLLGARLAAESAARRALFPTA